MKMMDLWFVVAEDFRVWEVFAVIFLRLEIVLSGIKGFFQ
ncbi:hypothetical protein PU02_1149 [Bartonella ancashensis]|uniref:Uncharacterized protein n=1 Tax=Bartonella ancashensis TaxID=1318743 RepID=A0A0M4L8V2_9HYPH|nr:hypothetical protein PU02_1149 [Bartonella ancashensis]